MLQYRHICSVLDACYFITMNIKRIHVTCRLQCYHEITLTFTNYLQKHAQCKVVIELNTQNIFGYMFKDVKLHIIEKKIKLITGLILHMNISLLCSTPSVKTVV